jgi:hypothetical protein
VAFFLSVCVLEPLGVILVSLNCYLLCCSPDVGVVFCCLLQRSALGAPLRHNSFNWGVVTAAIGILVSFGVDFLPAVILLQPTSSSESSCYVPLWDSILGGLGGSGLLDFGVVFNSLSTLKLSSVSWLSSLTGLVGRLVSRYCLCIWQPPGFLRACRGNRFGIR